ncbi:hypothetical protein [Okeania sp.]|uniref:hypothetical protein n=1 Tax=Okeania sp. TaxID=3100323 RepID=UPI002B4B6CEC|nr:hypothetical protein [Okeania sp.]MEB3340533.1 hypothetical protein [Okeania sp.]
MSNQPSHPNTNFFQSLKTFFKRLLYVMGSHPIIVALILLSSVFWGGIQFQRNLDEGKNENYNSELNESKFKPTPVNKVNPFLIAAGGWYKYDNQIENESEMRIKVTKNQEEQYIILNGTFPKAAGYVTGEIGGNILPFAGKNLTLTIEGSGNSTFDNDKMFRLEANDRPLEPEENSNSITRNLGNKFINARDGNVTFKLPSNLTKLNLVFWNATLNDLKISGTVSEK